MRILASFAIVLLMPIIKHTAIAAQAEFPSARLQGLYMLAAPMTDFEVPIDLEPQKFNESYYIAAQQDHPTWSREWVAIIRCPCEDGCSKKAWDRAQTYSFMSPQKAMQYCLHHLMWSGLHKLPKAEAIAAMTCPVLTWETGQDSFDEREHYRLQLDEIKKNKGTADAHVSRVPIATALVHGMCKGTAGPQGAGATGDAAPPDSSGAVAAGDLAGSVDFSDMVNKALAIQMRLLLEDQEDLTGSIHKRQRIADQAASSGSRPLELSAPMCDVTVTSDQLLHFRDTMVRAESALGNAKTRCLEMSRTIHNEQMIVRANVALIDQIAQPR